MIPQTTVQKRTSPRGEKPIPSETGSRLSRELYTRACKITTNARIFYSCEYAHTRTRVVHPRFVCLAAEAGMLIAFEIIGLETVGYTYYGHGVSQYSLEFLSFE